MRISGKDSVRVVFRAVWLVGFSAVLSAHPATFQLGTDPNQTYTGLLAGPYPGTLSDSSATEFMSLDLNLSATSTPDTPAEDEVAFLAAYLLQQGAPSFNQAFVNNFEGPISFVIWLIMETLTPPDPAAAFFVNLAGNAYSNDQITTAFLSNFLIFHP